MKLVLPRELYQAYPEDKLFSAWLQQSGTVHRQIDNRRTVDFYVGNKHYFIKCHAGIGLREYLKNCLRGKKPIVDASNEWHALQQLRSLQVNSLLPVGYGLSGINPFTRRSFIITEALEGYQELDSYCRARYRANNFSLKLKRQLIKQVAETVATMHRIGMAHRDCYLCHFLIDPVAVNEQYLQNIPLAIIDLHRATTSRFFSERQRAKDLAALCFSARELGLTQRDYWRFLRIYYQESVSVIGKKKKLLRSVWLKAQRLLLKYQRKYPQLAQQLLHMPLLKPRELYSLQQSCLPAAILLTHHPDAVKLKKVLRIAKGKRCVCLAEWQGRTVVAKIFIHGLKSRLHIAREKKGIKALQAAGVSSPRCLYEDTVMASHIAVMLFEFVPHQSSPDNQADVATITAFLNLAVNTLASMHEAGLLQSDIHPQNFLWQQQVLWAIDGSDLQYYQAMPVAVALSNLAQLFAQFGLKIEAQLPALYSQYWQQRECAGPGYDSFLSLLRAEQLKRAKYLARKSLRHSSLIKREKKAGYELLYHVNIAAQQFLQNKQAFFQAPLQILKKGNSATVITASLADQVVVVKRYNIKNKLHALKCFFRYSRGKKCWYNAHLLESLAIPACRPLLYLQEYYGPFKGTSYFIMNYLSAECLQNYMDKATLPARKAILLQVKQLQQQFYQLQLVHGDLKASNFLVGPNNSIELIDLDSLVCIGNKKKFQRQYDKDWQRFINNWPAGSENRKLCEELL